MSGVLSPRMHACDAWHEWHALRETERLLEDVNCDGLAKLGPTHVNELM
jgi:hypothetical protein